MDWFITLCVGVVVLTILFWCTSSVKRSSPPGPFPVPIVGNLLYIALQDPVNYIALHKISKKYGSMTSLQIGPNKNILISNSEIAKEIYSRSDCLSRPVNGPIKDRMLKRNLGMAFSNDEVWHNIRKFSSRTLKDFGFGSRSAMEELIKDELENLVNFINFKISQNRDGVLYFDHFFQISLLNLMFSMISGKRYNYEDKDLHNLVRASNEWFQAPFLGFLIIMAFPWTRYVCPKVLGHTTQMNALKEMHKYGRNLLEKQRKLNKYMEETTCFADSFLKMAENDESETFTDDQFAVLFVDLLQGGADTTSNWLSFAILLLMLHPDVQEKVYAEIIKEVGLDRSPIIQDQERMIYTQAVILEIHRHARLTVVMPPRVATESFKYRDYKIEKGNIILVNLHSCYMDPDMWEDAEAFRPERFLSADRSHIVNERGMCIIFGAGRRICFGESLAKESSFLYLTTLLQKFSFKIPSSTSPLPSAEPVPGLILSPKPYHVRIERRKSGK